jgi:hypothetical protein
LPREIQALAKAGVNVLVSLLTADEVAELELQDEERLCGDCGIRFISFPIPDRGVPFSTAEADLGGIVGREGDSSRDYAPSIGFFGAMMNGLTTFATLTWGNKRASFPDAA